MTLTGNFDYINKNKAQIVADGLTPFDDFYADDQNFEHTTVEDFYPIMNRQEYMYEQMCLQDRNITRDRDFEAQYTLTAGKDVQNPQFFNHPGKSSLIKQIKKERVELNSGTHVNFVAGDAIKLEPGFRALSGCHFHAKIESNPQWHTPEKSYPPTIDGNRTICGSTDYLAYRQGETLIADWELTGEGVAIETSGSSFTTPENLAPGQYTLYCRTNGTGTSKLLKVSTHETCRELQEMGVEEELAENRVAIYPNPADDQITIRCAEVINSYVINDAFGRLVEQNKGKERKQLKINVNQLQPGIYFIRLTTQSGTETHRFVKN